MLLKAEKLKLKNSGSLRLAILMPLACSLFSLIFGGSFNAISQTIYFWSGVFLFLLLQLLIYVNLNLEEKAGNFFYIRSKNLKKSNVYLGKIFWTIYYGFIGSLVAILIVIFYKFTMPKNELVGSSLNIILGILMIFISSFWIIPLFILLRKKINGFLIILINFIISFFLVPFVASSKFFFLIPYAYHYKVSKYFFHIKEAGDVLDRQITSGDFKEFLLGLLLSLVFFFALCTLVKRREENA